MTIKSIIFGLSSLLIASIAFSQSHDCLSYEPNEVSLTGKVVRDTFPGIPNYENTKKGDKPEIYWILKLQKLACVTADKGDSINRSENKVSEIQLVLEEKQYKQYSSLVNHKVIVSGKLFHAHTGHHHTAVLLQVKRIVAG